MMQQCKKFIVSGRVQGVCYRAATQTKAKQLGLTGWVKNLPSGKVNVLACGSLEKLTQLEQWLHQGPTFAKVSHVASQSIADENHVAFKVIK